MKNLVKSGVFICLLLFSAAALQRRMCRCGEMDFKHTFEDLNGRERNFFDIGVVGGSTIMWGWDPVTAFEEGGFSSLVVARAYQPAALAQSYSDLVIARHKPSLLVIDLTMFTTRYFNYVAEENKVVVSLIKFSRFNTLKHFPSDLARLWRARKMLADHYPQPQHQCSVFTLMLDGKDFWKSGAGRSSFVSLKNDGFGGRRFDAVPQELRHYASDPTVRRNREVLQCLEQLCRYLKERKQQALFVFPPLATHDAVRAAEYAYSRQMVEGYGFKAIDFCDNWEGLGLDPKSDFYDANHLNYHGAVKLTKSLVRVIKEEYCVRDDLQDPEVREYYGDMRKWILGQMSAKQSDVVSEGLKR